MEPLEKTGPAAIFALECSLVMKVDYLKDVGLEIKGENQGECTQLRHGRGENGCGGL